MWFSGLLIFSKAFSLRRNFSLPLCEEGAARQRRIDVFAGAKPDPTKPARERFVIFGRVLPL
jgi:hypothetical protein